MAQDFIKLTQYAKMFAGLTPEYETLLQEVGPQITPHLKEITEDFYRHLLSIPEAQAYLEGRVESLKATHTTLYFTKTYLIVEIPAWVQIPNRRLAIKSKATLYKAKQTA